LLFDINTIFKTFRVSLLLVFLSAVVAFGEESRSGDAIIAEGDGFQLTQKQIDEYRSAIAPDDKQNDMKGLLSAIFRYELLSREYFKKQKEMGVEPVPEASRTVEIKVQASKKYIQEVLNDYVIPDDVIESYYRSYPEKFHNRNTPGAVSGQPPLDDNLKKEIKFIIVEKKKNIIIEELVRNLVAKSNIKIINQ
jgi:hypothetical protein